MNEIEVIKVSEVMDWRELREALIAELGESSCAPLKGDIREVERVFGEICHLVSSQSSLPKAAMMIQNIEEIFHIFDQFPDSWRLALYLKKDFLKNLEKANISADTIDLAVECWKFYAYIRALKKDIEYYSDTRQKNPGIKAQENMTRLLQGTWGRRHTSFMKGIGFEALVEKLEKDANDELNLFFERWKSDSDRKLFVSTLENGIKDPKFPFERLYIDTKTVRANPEIDIPALNFLIFQTDLASRMDLLRNLTLHSIKGDFADHINLWHAWIRQYADLILDEESVTSKTFKEIFNITGPLFVGGKVPKEYIRQGFVNEKIPIVLCETLEEIYLNAQKQRSLKKKINERKRESNKAPSKIADILALTVIPESFSLKNPTPFVLGKGDQDISIDLSGESFPLGTEIHLERKAPNKTDSMKILNPAMKMVNPGRSVTMPPLVGRKYKGEVIYTLTVTLPETHRFPNNNRIWHVAHTIDINPPDSPEDIQYDMARRLQELIDRRDEDLRLVAEIHKDQETERARRVHFESKKRKQEEEDGKAKKEKDRALELAAFLQTTEESVRTAWGLALLEPENNLRSTIGDDGYIHVSLRDRHFISEIHNALYRSVEISPDDHIDVSDMMGSENVAALLIYAQEVRQREIKNIEKIAQEKKEKELHDPLAAELKPCLEILRDLAGTELGTNTLSGVTLNRTFRESKIPLSCQVVRKEEGPLYANVFTLNFTVRDVVATYTDSGVIFSGSGFTEASSGIQRAYEEFREVLLELGKFLFLSQSEKGKRLTKLKKERNKLVQGFIESLEAPKGKPALIALDDSQLVPSYLFASDEHAGFPDADCPEVQYIIVKGQDSLEKEYEKLRHAVQGGSNPKTSISVVCMVRKGYISMSGDPGNEKGKKQHAPDTIARNIESLSNSPQGRRLLWDRIYGTYGQGTGTRIENGPAEVLETIMRLYDHRLPTTEVGQGEFIDLYLDALREAGVLIAYVRFSAVTIKEVRAALEAKKK